MLRSSGFMVEACIVRFGCKVIFSAMKHAWLDLELDFYES